MLGCICAWIRKLGLLLLCSVFSAGFNPPCLLAVLLALQAQRIIKVWKSCGLRWTNYLRPDLTRGLLSEYEEKICGMTRDDAKLIELIVDDIFKKLINNVSSEKNGLVGMDSRLQKMDSLLRPAVGNVRFVGIWGMGGIGKTTIARAMYDKINHHFEVRCFLENVKGRFPSTDAGEAPLDMQAEILSSITNMKVGSSEILRNGFQKMMERVGKKKVLLVLDNVESSSQIEALIGKQPSFGGGSRIIITTRDKQSLSRLGDQIYEPELLNDDDALELFVQYAFSTKQPTEEYIDLSGHFIKYAQGLPLALKVLGAFLDNKSVLVWKDELKKIARNPHLGIQKVLRTSFDGLDDLQKEMFLDIACFFKQMKKDLATRIMEGCDFHPHTGLDVLVGRALVTISSDGVLGMHDLMEDMGHQIVREEYIKEPGRRSRLWNYEDVHHVLNKKKATEAIESIIVRWPHSENVAELDTTFVKMTKLRLLRVHTHSIEQLDMPDNQWQYKGLKFLSEKLSYLFWHKCPLKSLSSNFNPENLVEIDMQYSWVEHLWKGTKPLGKLKIINLKGSHRLKETPDFTEAKNLEKLILGGCTSLYEVHPSISALEKLVLLDLSWCGKLKTFSSNICMKSLEIFDLSFCSIFEKLPEISEVMENLSKLYLQGTAIKELPRSINNLTGLVTLNLEYCRELEILPNSIVQLRSLQFLNLSGCSKLKAFPENVGNMEGLRELRLDETSVEGLCPSILSLENLESLSLKQCKKLHSFPSSIRMRSLRTLNLSGCSNLYNFSEIPEVMNLLELNLDETAISELPSSIKKFTRLVTLSLKDCRRLKIFPGSIHMKSLQVLNVSGCSSLKNFPEFLKVMENLTELHLDWTIFTELYYTQASGGRQFLFSGIAIEELPSIIYSLTGLATLTLRYSEDFKSLTSSVCQLKSLNYLSLSGCTKFEVFPDILENMERLASLDLDSTSIRELPASIQRLQGLVSLNLKNCKSLVCLPDSICNLLRLEWLTLHGCSKLSKLPEDLRYLKHLDIEGTGIHGYRPEQQFITLGDLAQFRSTAPMIKAMVPNIEQNEAVADVEYRHVEERQDIAMSSYVEELREQQRLEEMWEKQQMREQQQRFEEMWEQQKWEQQRVEEMREQQMREQQRLEEMREQQRFEEMRGQLEEMRCAATFRRDAGGVGRDVAAASMREQLEEMWQQHQHRRRLVKEMWQQHQHWRRLVKEMWQQWQQHQRLVKEVSQQQWQHHQHQHRQRLVKEMRQQQRRLEEMREQLEEMREQLEEMWQQRRLEEMRELEVWKRCGSSSDVWKRCGSWKFGRCGSWKFGRDEAAAATFGRDAGAGSLEEMRQQQRRLEEMREQLEEMWQRCGATFVRDAGGDAGAVGRDVAAAATFGSSWKRCGRQRRLEAVGRDVAGSSDVWKQLPDVWKQLEEMWQEQRRLEAVGRDVAGSSDVWKRCHIDVWKRCDVQ